MYEYFLLHWVATSAKSETYKETRKGKFHHITVQYGIHKRIYDTYAYSYECYS